MPYYFENKTPFVGEIVVCKAIKLDANHIICELVEYNNEIGYLSFTELSFKSIYKIKKNYPLNKLYIFEVLSTSSVIQLTRSNFTVEDSIEYLSKFSIITSIVEFFDYHKNDIINRLMRSQNDYNKIYDLFSINVEQLYDIIESEIKSDFDKDSEFLTLVKKRFKLPKLKIEIEFSIKSNKYNGIIDIKNKLLLLDNAVKSFSIDSDDIQIILTFLGSPNYKLIIKNFLNDTDSKYTKMLQEKIINYMNCNDFILS